jgi:uncharacterized protein (DUF488 family)
MVQLWTIGHSTHPTGEFISLLKENNIKQLIDIRTIPASRHNPQFGQNNLEVSLEKSKIRYRYMKELGGLRPKVADSINLGWHNLSFRNYADYMQTDDFKEAINKLISYAKESPVAIMCAEAVPWRCHRSLVADALVVRNVEVFDIISTVNPKPHTLTSFAVVDGTLITYPNDESADHG